MHKRCSLFDTKNVGKIHPSSNNVCSLRCYPTDCPWIWCVRTSNAFLAVQGGKTDLSKDGTLEKTKLWLAIPEFLYPIPKAQNRSKIKKELAISL